MKNDAGTFLAALFTADAEQPNWPDRFRDWLLGIHDPDARADLLFRFDERAGIGQYERGMSRADAEREAFESLVRKPDARPTPG